MQAIWKVKLDVVDYQAIVLSMDDKILCVQEQDGVPCLWFIKNDISSMEGTRNFYIYGTGHIYEKIKGKYINTFQLHNGMAVFHIFEDIE